MRSANVKDHDLLDVASETLRLSILVPGAERDLVYENHPVVKDNAIIATKSVQLAYDIMVKNIVHRQPGTCFIGDFRVGKTKAIEKIVNELSETFPKLPVGKVSAKGHDPYTEKTFFTDLLADFKHGAANTGTTIERRNRLRMAIETHAHRLNSDQYLLMVDEGQNWDERQWHLLRDLTNDLAISNIRVLTATFGHPELLNIRSKLIIRRRTDLIGRFLLRPYQFRGLNSVQELQETLSAYDDIGSCSYPFNSNISYSEFFMPHAWETGWRLKHEANLLWTALAHVASRVNQQVTQVGMNWVGGAVRNFLFSCADNDCVGFSGTVEGWISAVESCDYESSLI